MKHSVLLTDQLRSHIAGGLGELSGSQTTQLNRS